MKSTQKIYDRLQLAEREAERISNIINEDESYRNRPYFLRNGKISESGWTFGEALLSYVTEKIVLQWVLKN